jgi:hypothetical protein
LAARGIITQDPDQRRRDWQQSLRALETNVNSHTTQQASISRSQNAAFHKARQQEYFLVEKLLLEQRKRELDIQSKLDELTTTQKKLEQKLSTDDAEHQANLQPVSKNIFGVSDGHGCSTDITVATEDVSTDDSKTLSTLDSKKQSSIRPRLPRVENH